jgi:hypothetical protein
LLFSNYWADINPYLKKLPSIHVFEHPKSTICTPFNLDTTFWQKYVESGHVW